MDEHTKDELFARARTLRAEIRQVFLDAEYWNRLNPTKVPIDVDPDGKLQDVLNALDKMLGDVPA